MQIDVIHLLPRANGQTMWHLRSHDPSPDFWETGRRWNGDSAAAVHRDQHENRFKKGDTCICYNSNIEDVFLCPGRQMMPWTNSWESLASQPLRQVLLARIPQDLIASRTELNPTLMASLAGHSPPWNVTGATIEDAHSINQVRIGGAESSPAADHINGTFMGDHL